MAKVWYKFGIGAISGTLADGVNMPAKSKLVGYIRRWVYPTLTANNTLFGQKGRNLGACFNNCASGFKDDFSIYAERYAAENNRNDHFNVNYSPMGWFVKGMYAWEESDPTHVDLTAVTPADMFSLDCDMLTVSRAIGAGFIPSISDYSDLTHPADS